MKILLAAISLLVSFNACAQPTTKQFDQAPATEKEMFNGFLFGVGSAYLIANQALISKGLAPFYCQPASEELGYKQYQDFLKAEIKAEKQLQNKWFYENTPIAYALLQHLEKAFPCK